MKLCPGCHNPFESSKLYKLFAVYCSHVDDGWFGTLEIQSAEIVAFEFLRSPEVICGNTGKWRAVPAKQQNTSSNKKTKSQKLQTNNKTRKPNQKYTNKKQNNKNLGKQTQPNCVNNGSVYNRVTKSMEYRWLWAEGICSRGNVRFEKEVGYSWHKELHVSAPYYLSSNAEIRTSLYCFLNVSGELSCREGLILAQILGPSCFKDLFPYLVWAICQKYAPL